ncbi:MAG TPA: ABC transporter ATP-binding protein [Candidatus Ozemobacteraceae bacterium]|nr:ABC transporter ATP-binding protein [Candidatus Ozemobacteraceae bacterium]
MTERTAMLDAVSIRKSFWRSGREIPVLRDVSLRLDAGETLVITGRSGTGKSTLLSLLGGLDIPDAGRIDVCGTDTAAVSQDRLAELRRETVGIIFQNFNLLPSWSAVENVEAALMHGELGPAERRERAIRWLERLGIGDRIENLPAELSVGQQQRVAVARTLVNEPKLILADEPTGDVDPETGAEIIAHLKAAVADRGAALLVVTHGTYPVATGDRVLRLRDGILEPAG